MIPECDHVGTPLGFDGFTHLTSSTTSGSASLMSWRMLARASPRQSPSSSMVWVIRAAADAAPPLSGRAMSAAIRSDGKVGEVALHSPVPLQSRHGALPPALHVVQGRLVIALPGGDRFPEVLILRLDDGVRVLAVVPQITRPAELSARHALHLKS